MLLWDVRSVATCFSCSNLGCPSAHPLEPNLVPQAQKCVASQHLVQLSAHLRHTAPTDSTQLVQPDGYQGVHTSQTHTMGLGQIQMFTPSTGAEIHSPAPAAGAEPLTFLTCAGPSQHLFFGTCTIPTPRL